MSKDIEHNTTARIQTATDLEELFEFSRDALFDLCKFDLRKLFILNYRARNIFKGSEKVSTLSLSPQVERVLEGMAFNKPLDIPSESKALLIGQVDLTDEKMILLGVGEEIIGISLLKPKEADRSGENGASEIAGAFARTAQRIVLKAIIEEQDKEIERCKNRIDSIVSDLNAIEQIKSNFISIASHELRTPLTVTRGYVEMLLEENGLDEVQKNTLNGVYKGVLKQEEILDSLFELAKFDSVSPVLNQERVLLSQLLKEVVKKLAKPIRERQLKVNFDIRDESSICVDTQSIRKLILNLLQNAIKFTPDQGVIEIEIETTALGSEKGVLLSIKDSGVGIEKDQLEVIFTRFYQPKDKLNTHSSGKTKFKGSGIGLGLALSRAIALAHNGKIWAESAGYDEKMMMGSEFKVFLPIKEQ